jgi:hypothetical protein
MNWPISQDYNEAIQNPMQAFSDVDLLTGDVVVGPMGVPLPRSGNFADVYHVRGADLRDWAVKCFTRPAVGLDVRYAKVSDALARAKLPFTVGFSFLAEGIQVGGVWRPVVKMEWVEGLMLHQVVRENAARPQVLAALAQLWVKLCRRLREAGIAHSDLQHGNVMLVPGARSGVYELKLIDYDGMFVPSLANTPTGETGHPAYQHPARTSKTYSPDLDRFPHLVVATALKALEKGGDSLWAKYDNGDNLLFTPQDFRDPAGSKLMRDLWTTGDTQIRALVGRLALSCGRPIPQTPWLDEIAPDGSPSPLNANELRDAEAALGLSTPVPIANPVVPAVLAKPAKPTPAKPKKAVPAVEKPEPIILAGPIILPLGSIRREHESQTEEPEWEEESRSFGLPLAIAGVVILFMIVGGVILFTRSKPKETVQNGPDVEKQGGGKSAEPKTTEPSIPKKSAPSPVKPKEPDPKPKEPDPELKPKEPEPKHKDSLPVVKEPAILTPAWNKPLETEGVPSKLYLDSEAQIILAGNERTPLFTLDFATGNKRQTTYSWFGLTGGNSFCPLDGGRVAKCLPDETEILTWELKTGKTGEKYPVPPIAPGTGKATHTYVQLSPDGRYTVIARYGAPEGEYATVPFCVFDNKSLKTITNEKMIIMNEWTGGSTHFTATSSRLLVAERNGRFRWFKRPDGEPDGEWDYGPPVKGRSHAVTAISRDGRVIGYNGPAKSQTESGPCLLDGKTGDVIHRFDRAYHENSAVVLSEDGRRAAVLRTFTGDEAIVDVVTVPKGDAIARAKVPTKRSIPTFTLSDRGETLLVHDAKSGKLCRFDLPAGITP